MAMKMNKDAYVGDTGKQLKDILTNANNISNNTNNISNNTNSINDILNKISGIQGLKIEYGKIAGNNFSAYTNSMPWYQAKYHLTFSKKYTSQPIVITMWTHDNPTGMGDVDTLPLNITTSGCDIYASYNISGIVYAWVQYIVVGV